MRNFIIVLVVALLFSSGVYFLVSKSDITEVNIKVTQETYDESVYKQTIENLGRETKVNVDNIYSEEIGKVNTKNSLVDTLEVTEEPEDIISSGEIIKPVEIKEAEESITLEEEPATIKPFKVVNLEDFISGGN